MQRERFRAHHILCTSLYVGRGYDGAFCENMTRVVERLRREPETLFSLAASPDLICQNCPNHDGAGHCVRNRDRVAEKDRAVMRRLHLEEGGTYSYREMCACALRDLDEAFFEECCGTCEWKRQGLCEYKDLTEQLARVVRSSSY